MGTLANGEDPDEMPQQLAFHKGLHCLLRENKSIGTEVHPSLETLICDPLICTMNHPRLTVSNKREEFISIQRVS